MMSAEASSVIGYEACQPTAERNGNLSGKNIVVFFFTVFFGVGGW